MSLHIEPTPLEGLYIVNTEMFQDERGSFMRAFCSKDLSSILEEKTLSQINLSTTRHKGTVRGMHYQLPPYAETKIVRCVKGSIFDVAIDVRKESSTFLQWFGIELNDQNNKALLVPEGFAHGFQALTDNSLTLYLHSALYQCDAEQNISHEDPAFHIKWPLAPTYVSQKDQNVPFINAKFEGVCL